MTAGVGCAHGVILEGMSMTEWIEHDGSGPPPLKTGQRVQVRLRDGFEPQLTHQWPNWESYHELRNDGYFDMDRSWWVHVGNEWDVVAYRIM